MSRIAYLLVIPASVIMLIVGAYPLLFSLVLSLSNFSITTPQIQIVGLHNFVGIFLDPVFWNSLGVTFIYVVGAVSSEIAVGILFGLSLYGNFRGRRFFMGILVIPLAVAPIIMGTLASPAGFWDDLNTGLFYGTGLGIFVDLFQPITYYTVIILSDTWLWAPLFMLVVLAIRSGIPKEQYEAAQVQGASVFQTFWRITLPNIIRSPVFGFVVALRAIDAFKAFEIPFAWTFWLGQSDVGAPVDTFSVLMWKLLTSSVYEFPLARIAAIALISSAIALLIAAATLRSQGRLWSD